MTCAHEKGNPEYRARLVARELQASPEQRHVRGHNAVCGVGAQCGCRLPWRKVYYLRNGEHTGAATDCADVRRARFCAGPEARGRVYDEAP